MCWHANQSGVVLQLAGNMKPYVSASGMARRECNCGGLVLSSCLLLLHLLFGAAADHADA
jgi:hypothetical protein